MPVSKVKDLNELTDILYYTFESVSLSDYAEEIRKRGRPPTVRREHLEALMKVIKTLVDGIHEDFDYMLPDKHQINDLLKVYKHLMLVKRKYNARIEALEKQGLITEPEGVNIEKI